MTKLTGWCWAAPPDHFRKMITAMARDPRGAGDKVADRLHNMRTMRFLAAGEAGPQGP